MACFTGGGLHLPSVTHPNERAAREAASDASQLDLALVELARMTHEIEALRACALDDADHSHIASLEAVQRALVRMVVERLEIHA